MSHTELDRFGVITRARERRLKPPGSGSSAIPTATRRDGAEVPRTVLLACKGWKAGQHAATAVNRLIRQTRDERQGNIQSRNILIVQMADPPSNSFAPDRDGLIGHDLQSHSQAICCRRIDRHAKIWCVAAVRGHEEDREAIKDAYLLQL
jgi:hypothetical protein